MSSPEVGGAVVVEVVGPAGAGKSTIAAQLVRQGGGRVGVASVYCNRRNLGAWVRAGGRAAPVLWEAMHRERINRELRWILRTEASSSIVDAAAAEAGLAIVVLDQGPVFTMARFLEAGPPARRGRALGRWWAGQLAWWTERLDAVVVVDAPDAVLVERIHRRDKDHVLKDRPHGAALGAVAAERDRLLSVVERLCRSDRTVSLPVDTAEGEPGPLAERLLARLEGVSPRTER